MPDKLEGEAAKVGGSLKEQLTKKLGPLPVWAWIGIGVGALFMLGFFKKKGNGTVAGPLDSNATTLGGNTGDTGGNPFSDPFGNSTGGAATAPDPITGDTGGAPATVQPLPVYVAPAPAGDTSPTPSEADPNAIGWVTPIVEAVTPAKTPSYVDPVSVAPVYDAPAYVPPDTSTVPTDGGVLVGPDLGHQSPDAVDRNAAYNAVPIVIPYTQSPDAIDRNKSYADPSPQSPDAVDRNKQYADPGTWVSPIYTGAPIYTGPAIQSPDAVDRNMAQAPSAAPFTPSVDVYRQYFPEAAPTPAQQPQPTYGAPAGTAY